LVLPDGCIDDIWMGGEPFVAGPATMTSRPETTAGIEIVGVRFLPGVAPALLGVSARELLNQDVPLRDIWPQKLAASWQDVWAHPTPSERFESIGEVVAQRAASVDEPDALVGNVVAWFASHPRGTVAALPQDVGFSERQIRRRVEEAVGYGPKTLQRILRLQRLLWLAGHAPSPRRNLASLAFAAGYADQPHMTREVAVLAGSTPGPLLTGSAPASALSDFFKTVGG
jgi:AraC-like DNA-binding protein